MFSGGYLYPVYRSWNYPVFNPGWGYPGWNYGGNWGYSSNIIGSAVANQSIINTGSATGINQIATPSVIW